MQKNIDAEINYPQIGGIDGWRNTADISRLKGRYVKFGNIVILEATWTGSANNQTIICTLPVELRPSSVLSSAGSGVITISGTTTKAEYTMNTDGTVKQAESVATGQSGTFIFIYSLV